MRTPAAVRAAGAFLLALACVLGLTLPASATTTAFTPVDPTAIPADAVGSLVIHKHAAAGLDPAAYPANGSVLTLPEKSRPIAGAVFTVARVDGVDVRTTDGWKQVQALQGDLPAARSRLGDVVTSSPTGTDGVAVVRDLPVGLYLVHEVGVVRADGQPDPAYVGAADFLVTVPVVAPDGAGWSYDVNVYPKNTHLSARKTVADGSVGVAAQDAPVAGRVLTFTIDADVPRDGLRAFGGRCERDGRTDLRTGRDEFGFAPDGQCAPGATYVGTAAGAAYSIVDDLTTSVVPGTKPVRHTSDFLELSAPDWAGAVTLTVAGADTTPLRACTSGATDCDYTLTRASGRIAVSLNDSGLTRLASVAASDPGAVVRLTLQARVRDTVVAATALTATQLAAPSAAPVLTLSNTAVLRPNGTSPGIATNTTRTLFSTLRVHKVAAGTGADLSGAVFTLYRTREDALARRTPLAVSAPTRADGLTQLAGLHVNDLQNDGPATDSYWLVETTAPQGYAAASAPVRVRVLQDGTTEDADVTGGVQVVNHPTTPGSQGGGGTHETPATGPKSGPGADPDGSRGPNGLAFTGIELMQLLLLGGGLVGSGLVLAWLARRRRDDVPETA